MNICQKCRYSNIPANCQYCPACGSPLGTLSASGPANGFGGRQLNLGQLLIDQLVSAAERMVQSRVQQGFAPIGQIIQQFTGGPAGPPVPSTPPPAWYEAAYQEGQPKMDPTEVIRRQADAQARARQGAQMLQMAMKSQHDSQMSILGNIKS